MVANVSAQLPEGTVRGREQWVTHQNLMYKSLHSEEETTGQRINRPIINLVTKIKVGPLSSPILDLKQNQKTGFGVFCTSVNQRIIVLPNQSILDSQLTSLFSSI